MKRVVRLPMSAVLILSAGTAPASDARPPDPTGDPGRAPALVRQLADPSFAARDHARSELFRLGLSAREAMLRGAADSDPEVRRCCRALLPAVLEADRKARVEAFLADKDGKKEHDLPGWSRFRAVAGDGPASRELFAEMMKGDGGRFLADYEASWEGRRAADAAPPAAASDLFVGRCMAMQERLYGNMRMGGLAQQQTSPAPLTRAEVATVLFAACDGRLKLPPNAVWLLPQFLYQPAPRQALTQGPQPSPFRKLLLAWMNNQTDENGMQQVFYLAINLDIKEALDVAVRALKEKKARGHGLGMAAIVVGKLGGRQHLPLLEPLMADNTALGTFRFNDLNISTEIRDVALAVSVKLTGQQHKDYDFPFLKIGPNMLEQSPYYLGFTSAAQRDAAFKKWEKWKADQSKKK